MSDQVNNNLAGNSLQDKIEKLMELINECATSQNRQQLDKCEKLQQKLRYLQYYQSYDLGPCPESWKCSECKEMTVQRKVTVGFDRVMENLPSMKVITIRERQIQCGTHERDHYKEWESEEKFKTETRNNIRRDYLAMIRKEKDLRSYQKSSDSKSVVYTTVDQPAQAKIRNKNRINIQENIESANIQEEIKENQRNFHGENCKTCKRMISIMGSIIPHPLNA